MSFSFQEYIKRNIIKFKFVTHWKFFLSTATHNFKWVKIRPTSIWIKNDYGAPVEFHAGPASTTLGHHETTNGWTLRSLGRKWLVPMVGGVCAQAGRAEAALVLSSCWSRAWGRFWRSLWSLYLWVNWPGQRACSSVRNVTRGTPFWRPDCLGRRLLSRNSHWLCSGSADCFSWSGRLARLAPSPRADNHFS